MAEGIENAGDEDDPEDEHEFAEVEILNHQRSEVVGTIDTDENLDTESNELREVLQEFLRPKPKQYAPRWPRSGGVPDFAITSLPIDVAMQNDLRFIGEVKPPKLKNARNDMN
ncbi:hypothetical protein [Haloarcula sp. JP-L23]|uniref:hypothetical protein n=1 Tax=Haloarcula sp. JP-L23 TaxID=2716717 RepID=UPI001878CA4F